MGWVRKSIIVVAGLLLAAAGLASAFMLFVSFFAGSLLASMIFLGHLLLSLLAAYAIANPSKKFAVIMAVVLALLWFGYGIDVTRLLLADGGTHGLAYFTPHIAVLAGMPIVVWAIVLRAKRP